MEGFTPFFIDYGNPETDFLTHNPIIPLACQATPMMGLPTFPFAISFSAKKQACGPGARALRAKSIGGK
jgi:hypothetical protein